MNATARALIPMVIESTGPRRARLRHLLVALKERIIFLGTPVDDSIAT